ncbi:hypothetical protein B7C62_28070 [Kitasatospora albolonga]|uniref:ATP-grasp-modified RiPP n=1 Tax=Kitasatospora albolonga TaxID=68173 RepID=A0ABC8BZ26_9ACTN|nr:hypothetical protein B7C62_28070 [Kitasatospora albolonga]
MARVRYVGRDPVTVPELGGRSIQPDEMVEVPDDRYDGYVCQPGTWEAVEDPKPSAPAAKKATPAAKSAPGSTSKEG